MKETKHFIRSETACFSGHRMIPEQDLAAIRQKTSSAVTDAYNKGYRTFISGGARGFDTIAAEEVLHLRKHYPDISLVIAVPCASQADRWPKQDQEVYRHILNSADDVILLSESYYEGCMLTRNRFMVDNASLCLCYMVRFEGGTWYTVRYALHQSVMLRNIAMGSTSLTVMKEPSWNSIYTFRSAEENATIVRLSRSRANCTRKKNISGRFLMKRS